MNITLLLISSKVNGLKTKSHSGIFELEIRTFPTEIVSSTNKMSVSISKIGNKLTSNLNYS